MPAIPHSAAGWRMEPPVSVPSVPAHSEAVTAAAEPPDEPPGTRARSHGFKTGPNPEFSFDEPIANSSWLVLPSNGAPASNSCCTTVAVYGGRYPSRIRDPAWLGTPCVQNRSLTASGTPPSGASSYESLSGAASATQVNAFSSSAEA